MNTFVGVPQPDSRHKPLLNLVNSVHINAGASQDLVLLVASRKNFHERRRQKTLRAISPSIVTPFELEAEFEKEINRLSA
jgi:hypothetical protein